MKSKILGLPTAALLAAAALVAPPQIAGAAVIVYQFGATQTSTTTPTSGLALTAAGFTSISGTLSYDDSISATSTTLISSLYPTGTLSITEFAISAGVFSAPFTTVVLNSDPSFLGDAFQMATGGSTPNIPVVHLGAGVR